MLIQLAELSMSQDINDRPILIWENSTVKRDFPVRWSLIGILPVIGWECRSFMRESAWTWEINFQIGELSHNMNEGWVVQQIKMVYYRVGT